MSGIALQGALLLVLLIPAPGQAVFHFAVIDEVMSGAGGDSTLQYVEIRMLGAGQNNVCHSRLTVFKCQADGGGAQVLIYAPCGAPPTAHVVKTARGRALPQGVQVTE